MDNVGEIRSCRIFSEIKREAQFIAKRDTVFFLAVPMKIRWHRFPLCHLMYSNN